MKHSYIVALVSLFLSVTMTAQVVQVTDIKKTGDSGIGSPYAWNGKIYFEADAGDEAADELYVYDGDSAYLLANINQDSLDTSPNSDPKNFIEYNGKLYFQANGGDNTGVDVELYVTDGTTEGTELVYDIYPGPGKGSLPMEMFTMNETLYFYGKDGSNSQIWKYDGVNTPEKVTNERSGGYFNPFYPTVDGDKAWLKGITDLSKYQLCTFDGTDITVLTNNSVTNAYSKGGVLFNDGFLFNGADSIKDKELWFSNGTPEGTALLVDIATDSAASSDPQELTVVDDNVYFIPEIEGKTQLWKTDGTAEGTELVYLPTDTIDVEMENLNYYAEKLYFTLTTQEGNDELWVYDFMNASKVATIGTSPNGFIEVDGLLFFISDKTLWYTEGYTDVTMAVDSLFAGNDSYSNADDEYAVDGSVLYFTADDSTGYDDIFAIDASLIERKYLPIVLDGIASLYFYNNELFFEAEDQNNDIDDELYKQTADGEIVLVSDINQDPDDSSPRSDPKNFIEYKGLLYFQANGGDNTGVDIELYVTDGTSEGTKLVYDIYPGIGKGSLPMELFVMNDTLYFYAKDGANSQIWKYDGVNTPEKVTNERSGGYFNPFYPVVDGDKAWLKGITDLSKYQLCTFDGTDITVLTNNSVTNAYFKGGVLFNDGFLFNGVDENKDKELWFSNGTPEGTAQLVNIATDSAASSNPEELTVMGDKVYFISTLNEMTEIWCTDGTTEGTMVAYNPADTVDAEIENLNVINDKLVFTANCPQGTALYKLTDDGAVKLAQVADSPEDFYMHDGLLFFVAGDSLWYTEGTKASTMAVPADIFEGGMTAMDVDGGEFVSNGTMLCFVAEADGKDIIVSIDASDIERDPFAIDRPILIDNIAGLHLYKNELYFEAEDQHNNIDDELYKQTADGEIVLVADINQDPDDSTPRSDPKNFIEYNGMLYFQANGGDNTGVDVELYVTDGTTEGTKLVYDIYPGTGKGSLPMEFFVMNDTLYFYAKDGANSQIWKYDGVNTPVKVTNERSGGYFNPFYPIVDGDKAWLKGITDLSKYQLCTFDGTDITVLTNNSVANAYFKGGVLFNDGFLFNGVGEDKDKELWFSNGTAEGTAQLVNIAPDSAASSNPEELTVMGDKVYFIATLNDMTEIWSTDGTAEGTMVAYNPADTVDTEIENLNIINGKLVFTANNDDEVALYKLTDTGAEMIAQVGDSPEDFFMHDGLLFFVADDALWYTEGTTASTMAVPAEVFDGGIAAMDVDGGEFVSNGTKLHFVAEEDGLEVIVTIDAADIDRDPAASISERKALAETVSLYPMPSNGIITIESAFSFSSYKVFDLSLKEVASSTLEGNQINVSLEKGMYILQLEGAETSIAKTIMIK